MPVTKLSISLPPDLVAELDARGDERSSTLSRTIERYLALLAASRRRLAELLTDQEVGLICDILNGTLFAEPFSVQMLDREVADSLIDGYAEKWAVDGPALVEKLRGLTYIDQMAMVDAVERWWERVGRGESKLSPSEALRPKPKRQAK